MSVRTSSAGLRSEGLFDRIRSERNRRGVGSAARRLARATDLFGGGVKGASLPSLKRPASLKGRKSD
jgi:hypothetical protein